MDETAPVRQALELLVDEVARRVDKHPAGHLIGDDRQRLRLEIDVPMDPRDGDLERLATELWQRLDEGVRDILLHRASFRAGRVFCLRCSSADCEHALPAAPRHVFAGYGPTGMPRFVDLGELLLSRGDPRVGELFDDDGGLVTREIPGEDLTEELLPAFRQEASRYQVLGEVVSGWYRIPDPAGRSQAMALTIQVVSARHGKMRPRFGVNVLGVGPGGEPLEHLLDRIDSVPWTAAVRWAQSVLRNAKAVPPRRAEGLVAGIARRLERESRSSRRRTRHATSRHEQGNRPTRMAWADLSRAAPGSLLFDTRAKTLIVLGERGRSHVFSTAGKLVTSVRYPPATVTRRVEKGVWRTATPEEEALLREKSGSATSAGSS